MSLSCEDVVEHITSLLDKAGYSFHEGEDPGTPELGMNAHWFCWAAPGMADCEVGETVDTPLAALITALDHWFDSASIPLDLKT